MKTARYEGEIHQRMWPVTNYVGEQDAIFFYKVILDALKGGAVVNIRRQNNTLCVERSLRTNEVLCGCDKCLHVFREQESGQQHKCQLCSGPVDVIAVGKGKGEII